MAFEIGLSLVMNYPSMYGDIYYEEASDFNKGMPFCLNDLFLCMMLFCRFQFLIRTILSVSFYTDPRS